ncbi:hypothetical protein LTR15_000165 [Elasticomyces elasticus]|nr:hypothetical protein LTR15_000165 [Elasticomyces elasticus]
MAPSNSSASKSVAMATDKKPFRFTSLPRELRDAVYDMVLIRGGPIRRCTERDDPKKVVPININVLLVDKAMHREALESLCRVCCVHASNKARHIPPHGAWTLINTLPNHSLQIQVDDMWLHRDASCVMKFLQTIIDSAAQRQITVNIQIQSSRSEFPIRLIGMLRTQGKTTAYTKVGSFNFSITSTAGLLPSTTATIHYVHHPIHRVFDPMSLIASNREGVEANFEDVIEVSRLMPKDRWLCEATGKQLDLYYETHDLVDGSTAWSDLPHTVQELEQMTEGILRSEMQARLDSEDERPSGARGSVTENVSSLCYHIRYVLAQVAQYVARWYARFEQGLRRGDHA